MSVRFAISIRKFLRHLFVSCKDKIHLTFPPLSPASLHFVDPISQVRETRIFENGYALLCVVCLLAVFGQENSLERKIKRLRRRSSDYPHWILLNIFDRFFGSMYVCSSFFLVLQLFLLLSFDVPSVFFGNGGGGSLFYPSFLGMAICEGDFNAWRVMDEWWTVGLASKLVYR